MRLAYYRKDRDLIRVSLSGNNSFIGPIVVSRGTLSIKNSRSIPPRSSLTVLNPGSIKLADGVTLNLGRLALDGEVLAPGKYVTADFPDSRIASISMTKPEGVNLKQLKPGLIGGLGILNVLS